MTSFEHDMAKTFGIGLPEEPDDVNIKRVLNYMEHCTRQRMRLTNPEDVVRTRGTPGEVIPKYEVLFFAAVRFFDDFRETYPIMDMTHVKRLDNGETLVFKVIKNEPTPDAPPNFYYADPRDAMPNQYARLTGRTLH